MTAGGPGGRRTVLVVSYRYPPHGGGGVQRTAYFTRLLGGHGWDAHVLTGPLEARRLTDAKLLGLVGAIRVTRTGQLNTHRVYQALVKLRMAGLARAITPAFPNMQAGWIPNAVREALRIVRSESVDLVYSSAYPVASHVVAQIIKERTGLPWVADYRDEWSIRPVLRWPTRVHQALARSIDRRIIQGADRVITTSPNHTRSLSRAFRPGDVGAFATITNGFDEADFAGPRPPLPDPDLSSRFVLAHVGSIFRWRGANHLLSAIRRLVEGGHVPRLAVCMVGTAADLGGNEDLRHSDVLREYGYVTHPLAVQWMRSSDALILINTEESNIPGKTFEYLASGRPILGTVRSGATEDLLRQHGAVMVLRHDDEEAMCLAIRDMYEKWAKGQALPTRSLEEVRGYTRSALTERLADVFDEVSPATAANRVDSWRTPTENGGVR